MKKIAVCLLALSFAACTPPEKEDSASAATPTPATPKGSWMWQKRSNPLGPKTGAGVKTYANPLDAPPEKH
jgi:hypothetical protein